MNTEKKRETWDPAKHAAEMRKSMGYVSALYFIDSPKAVDACHRAFAALLNRDILDAADCQYFQKIREIVTKGGVVINVDHRFKHAWDNNDRDLILRVHSLKARVAGFESGKYEAELQIPGRIANSLSSQFGNGDDGRFWCGFMTYAFYD